MNLNIPGAASLPFPARYHRPGSRFMDTAGAM